MLDETTDLIRHKWIPDTVSTHYDGCWQVHHACATNLLLDEIVWLRVLCAEAQAFIRHNPNCGALMGWAKNCSCGYDELWKRLDV